MKAVVLERRGPGGIRVTDFPEPARPAGNALVRMRAASLNHADLYMRDRGSGITHALPMVLGLDGAGEVVEADADSGLKPGDRVMTFTMEFCGRCPECLAGEQPFCERLAIIGETRHGTYSEVFSARAHCFLPVPDGMSWEDAAALPVGHLTAYRMLFGKVRLRPAETVVIMGIGGGVALAALQLAKAAGLRAIVTSSSDEKLAKAAALGADEGINYGKETVFERVRDLTGGEGAGLVIDNVGEATWADSLRSARKGGAVVCCGTTSGANPPADLQRVFVRQLRIFGSTYANMDEARALLRLVSETGMRPVIDSTYAMDDALDAIGRMERAEQFGKIVLTIP